uniref:ATP synthase complex subunit 8 n=1 Tax=Acroneuria carolinensis TaxID=219317 RepID=A0A7S6TYR1_ACRCA|nr:ATP synthase F0 subunit 8 [Acroneuria carolinensis]QOV02868.1 ATP synthase F0 subunit 8 [Acroneuria carolinensis]
MPQMAPISWLALFLIFSGTLLVFNFMNYFSFLPQSPSSDQGLRIAQTPMHWKW